MSKNDGGAAFPIVTPDGADWNIGMSLRDYFAAQALQGWIMNGAVKGIILREKLSQHGALLVLAAGCYQVADAMLTEREK